MVCIYCGSRTKVGNSRLQKRNNQIWRRRQCLKCHAIFTTHEGVDMSSALLVDGVKGPEPFMSDLLFADLLLALKHRKDRYIAAREASSTVIKDLLAQPNKLLFEPTEISLVASKVLARLDEQAWLRFTSEHPSLQA